MKHVPNALTIFRILLAPVFLYVYFSNYQNHHLWALFIFLFAGLTDITDGYLARKYNAVSNIGIALDPLADKLILLAALGAFYFDKLISGWVLFIMLAIESILMVIGTYLHFKEGLSVIPSNRLGKIATLAFTFAIALLFLLPDSQFTLATVIIAVFLKAAAFYGYMKKILSKL